MQSKRSLDLKSSQWMRTFICPNHHCIKNPAAIIVFEAANYLNKMDALNSP